MSEALPLDSGSSSYERMSDMLEPEGVSMMIKSETEESWGWSSSDRNSVAENAHKLMRKKTAEIAFGPVRPCQAEPLRSQSGPLLNRDRRR